MALLPQMRGISPIPHLLGLCQQGLLLGSLPGLSSNWTTLSVLPTGPYPAEAGSRRIILHRRCGARRGVKRIYLEGVVHRLAPRALRGVGQGYTTILKHLYYKLLCLCTITDFQLLTTFV